jgi:hypothetical protein
MHPAGTGRLKPKNRSLAEPRGTTKWPAGYGFDFLQFQIPARP